MKYEVGDYIEVERSGSREHIRGFIREIYFNLYGYSAVVGTDNGERIISTETDRVLFSK